MPTHRTANTPSTVFKWEEQRTSNILQGHDEIVWAVEVAGSRLFSASADKTIRVWDIDSKRCTQVRIGYLAHSSIHRFLTSKQPCLTCFTCRAQVLEDHTRPVLSLEVYGNKLFSGSYDYSIRVWNLTTLQRTHTLTGHTDAVRALAVANGKLFSGSYDGTVKVRAGMLLTRE